MVRYLQGFCSCGQHPSTLYATEAEGPFAATLSGMYEAIWDSTAKGENFP